MHTVTLRISIISDMQEGVATAPRCTAEMQSTAPEAVVTVDEETEVGTFVWSFPTLEAATTNAALLNAALPRLEREGAIDSALGLATVTAQ